MRVLTVGVLCGCLLLSGCSRQKVNEVSVFEYKSGDDALMTALKTSGNVVPWVAGFVFLVIVAAPGAALQAAVAASNSRK